MENASKALLIAGGVLLAIIVLTMGIYLKGNFNNVADQYITSNNVSEIQKYNIIFENCYNSNTDKKAQDIVTLIEFAKEKGNITEVNVKGINYTSKEEWNSSDFIKKNSDKSYSCIGIEYDEQGRVKSIKFD